MSYLRPEGKDLIKIFIIDRAACGMGYELIRGEFEYNFKQPLSKELYSTYVSKYSQEIEQRKEEIQELIYQSGTYSKLIDISNILFDSIKKGDVAPKEISTLAATLRGYLDTMSQMGRKTETVYVKQQNNFLILQDLEKEGLIEIHDADKLKSIVDE